MPAETVTAPGQRLRRGFAVSVRTPGRRAHRTRRRPGLDPAFAGAAPSVTEVEVTPGPRARKVLLIGDSTVCDQPGSRTPAGASSCRST
ncbi:hypothetical protein ACLGIH_01060 [Streptomyces sp. HMX87]|uniref:hypothetical protein n=1 Tax=Streptomyces sp. HMX87 TaxID=3390849 RepID=UPI003A888A9E